MNNSVIILKNPPNLDHIKRRPLAEKEFTHSSNYHPINLIWGIRIGIIPLLSNESKNNEVKLLYSEGAGLNINSILKCKKEFANLWIKHILLTKRIAHNK